MNREVVENIKSQSVFINISHITPSTTDLNYLQKHNNRFDRVLWHP